MPYKRTVTFRGKQITNPTAVNVLTVLLLVLAPFIILFSLAWLAITLPIAIPLHFILKAFGRRGFVIREINSVKFVADSNGFRKA